MLVPPRPARREQRPLYSAAVKWVLWAWKLRKGFYKGQDFSRRQMTWTRWMVFPSLKGAGVQTDSKGLGTQDSRKRMKLISWWADMVASLTLRWD